MVICTPVSYTHLLPKHLPSQSELAQQREEKFSWEPKFSIVVPLFKTPEKYLGSLIRSIQAQTYGNWELCLSDGSGIDSKLEQFVNKFAENDNRIVYIPHESCLQISENTNAAIEAASGEFIVFADHDDELTPDALYAVSYTHLDLKNLWDCQGKRNIKNIMLCMMFPSR